MKNKILITPEIQEELNSLNDMIQSCFTYGGAERNSYNFNRYILPYENRLGKVLFNISYNAFLGTLKSDYKVEYNTSTDHEGLTYNSLVKIN